MNDNIFDLDDYTVIDLETTGLDPSVDDIIEMSAIRYRGGIAADSFSTLVKPASPVSDFIIALTGITNEELSTAPVVQDAARDFCAFIGGDVLVGQNIRFDLGFLRAALASDVINDHIDTLRLSCRLLPELKHHRLSDLAAFFGIDYNGAHRSLRDCEITNAVYCALIDYADAHGVSPSDILQKKRSGATWKISDLFAETSAFDPADPLYNKTVVFTGALERMPRKDAMQVVLNHGGKCSGSVSKKTDYLVLGNNDYNAAVKDGKSNKQKAAEELILSGADIIILSENAFYDMLEQA